MDAAKLRYRYSGRNRHNSYITMVLDCPSLSLKFWDGADQIQIQGTNNLFVYLKYSKSSLPQNPACVATASQGVTPDIAFVCLAYMLQTCT